MADSIPLEHLENDPEKAQKRFEKALDIFQSRIMCRCEKEQDIEKEKAKCFFQTQFGLDFGKSMKIEGDTTDPIFEELCIEGGDPVSEAVMQYSVFLPEFRNHVYMASNGHGEAHTFQSEVREGGFTVSVTNMWLYGAFGKEKGEVNENDPKKRRGVFVKSGKLAYGDFNIKTGPNFVNKNDVVIHFQTPYPLVRNDMGMLPIVYDLWHDDWLNGQYVGTEMLVKDCYTHSVIRSVLTFPKHIWHEEANNEFDRP